MPFSMNTWEIIYLYMFWIFYFDLFDITAPFGLFAFLWHSTPAYLFYFIFIVCLIFALMAKLYFICLCILYVCTYYSPLFTCVIDQTGCRRENGAEPVIASARCLTARSLPTIPWIFSLRRNQRSSTTPLAQPPSTASPPCPASFTPGESFSYATFPT